MLPDGRTVLFTLANQGAAGDSSWDEAQIVAQSLDGGARRVVVQGGWDARTSIAAICCTQWPVRCWPHHSTSAGWP